MRNHELRGIFVIGLLCLAALGVLLFGVVAKAEPIAKVTRFPASPAAQLSVKAAAGMVLSPGVSLATFRQVMVRGSAGNLVPENFRFQESKKEKHYA
jgi:hypothetical protein